MPAKRKTRSGGDELRRAMESIRRERDQAKAHRRRDLAQRHKLEMRALDLELKGHSKLAKAEAVDSLDRHHSRQRRDLEDEMRAEDSRRWEADGCIQITVGAHQELHPSEARALRDYKALDEWNQFIAAMNDAELVAWLTKSHLPTIDRPRGVLPFFEAEQIPALQERLAIIRTSRNTALQRALGKALSPVARGRQPHRAISQTDVARLRTEVEDRIRAARTESFGDVTLRAACVEIVADYLPHLPDGEQRELAAKVGRHEEKVSRAAAIITAAVYAISVDKALRGKAPKRSRAKARRRRLSSYDDRIDPTKATTKSR